MQDTSEPSDRYSFSADAAGYTLQCITHVSLILAPPHGLLHIRGIGVDPVFKKMATHSEHVTVL